MFTNDPTNRTHEPADDKARAPPYVAAKRQGTSADALAGGRSLHRYVRRLASRPGRALTLTLWLGLAQLGALLYFPLTAKLAVSVEPPIGAPSYVAKKVFKRVFGIEPVMVVPHLTVRDRSDGRLFNKNATLYPTYLPPFVAYDARAELTDAAVAISRDLYAMIEELGVYERCELDYYSVFEMPSEMQVVAQKLLVSESGHESLINLHLKSCDGKPVYRECVFRKEPHCEPIGELIEAWQGYSAELTAGPIHVALVSYPSTYDAIIEGIEWGMLLSTVSTMLAFVVLVALLRNVRQLLLVAANIVCTIGATLSVLYPVATYVMDVNVCAPAFLVAVALAMSIDYSLFLLTRFNEELLILGRLPRDAVGVALATQGHTVITSGATLALCYASMLILPTSTITSMAVGAAVAVMLSVFIVLSLTPALLLAAPRFFTSGRLLGLSLDGTPFEREPADLVLGSPTEKVTKSAAVTPVTGTVAAPEVPSPRRHRSPWAALGEFCQKASPIVFVLLAASSVPFYDALKDFRYVEDLTPLMPLDSPTTTAYTHMQDTFGQEMLTPIWLLVIAPEGTDTEDVSWNHAACKMLHKLAYDVTVDLQSRGMEYNMTVEDFAGLMMFNGECVADGVHWNYINIIPYIKIYGAFGKAEEVLETDQGRATMAVVSARLDLFSTEGEAWMRSVRDHLPRDAGPGTAYAIIDGVAVGELHLKGLPIEQMDGASYTLAAMPTVALTIAVIIALVLGLSYGAFLLPFRAVMCIGWMLIVTFGASVMVYQYGYLRFLGMASLTPSGGGAQFWISPSVAVAVLVGLGLDYDIFLMDAVMEHYNEGKSGREAMRCALEQSGTIICAAGAIMIFAFSALCLCTTPVLNQIGFILCVGVFIDCFITTKVTIPALMALLPDCANFWPLPSPEEARALSYGIFDEDEENAPPQSLRVHTAETPDPSKLSISLSPVSRPQMRHSLSWVVPPMQNTASSASLPRSRRGNSHSSLRRIRRTISGSSYNAGPSNDDDNVGGTPTTRRTSFPARVARAMRSLGGAPPTAATSDESDDGEAQELGPPPTVHWDGGEGVSSSVTAELVDGSSDGTHENSGRSTLAPLPSDRTAVLGEYRESKNESPGR